MKAIQVLIVSLLIVLAGMPIPALAQSAPEVFALPDGIAGGNYQANIQTVLRETYQLKLETDIRASVFRWSLAGGELPPGLIVRANGTITGSPRVPRDEPYRFEVRVTDAAYAGSEALKVNLVLKVAAHQVRLTRIKMPRLAPINGTAEAEQQTGPAYISSEGNHAANATNSTSHAISPAFSYAPTPPREVTRRTVSIDLVSSQAATSPATPGDASHIMRLIKPVLNTLHVASPASLPALFSQEILKVDPSKETTLRDKIRGPAKIELKNLNVLRYDIRIGKDVTFPAGPDLKLPFIPPIPSETPVNVANAFIFGAATGDAIPDAFSNLATEFNDVENDKATDVNGVIVDAITASNLASSTLEALVAGSDSILTTAGGAQAILDGLKPLVGPVAVGTPLIDDALRHLWPDAKIEELVDRLQTLRNNLLTLRTTPVPAGQTTWVAWYTANQVTYEAVVARVSELQTQLDALKSTSTQGTAFRSAQDKLRRWKPILIGVRQGSLAGFDREVEVGCGFAFNTGKETKVKIVKRDRLGEPSASPTEEEIVTVVCSSPLSVSAGFGFSNIDEQEFVFVPSTKTVTANGQTTQTVISRFGFRNKSSFRTLPVLLLNTRVWEPSDTFALHVSTGAAVDIKTGQGGTDLEYIVGPSISFWRSLFITPGLHIGRVPRLAGGFELDQEVPTGISEPPVEKSWKKGFVTTFTYKIK